MNRRVFTQLSSMAFAGYQLAGARLPGQGTGVASGKPVRFAVVGLGGISDIFMRACETSQHCKVTALVSGHAAAKTPAYMAKYGIPASSVYTYDDFDRIRENHEVDAVYIGLPNSMHCDFTVRAAAAGKHVLCEKPMAISSAECRRMIDACRKADVRLMIAYRIHFEPLWKRVESMIASGAIGQVQSFQGGFFNHQQAGAWRLDRALAGGGPILDLGIYPLNAIRHLTGEEPVGFTAVTATRDTSGRFAQVEQSMEWTMKMPSGIIASCSCSYGQTGVGFLQIHGDKGMLDLNPGFNYDGLRLTGLVDGKRIEMSAPEHSPYQFTLEADYFAECVRQGRPPEPDGGEGLKDMLAIEAVYRAAGAPIA